MNYGNVRIILQSDDRELVEYLAPFLKLFTSKLLDMSVLKADWTTAAPEQNGFKFGMSFEAQGAGKAKNILLDRTTSSLEITKGRLVASKLVGGLRKLGIVKGKDCGVLTIEKQ